VEAVGDERENSAYSTFIQQIEMNWVRLFSFYTAHLFDDVGSQSSLNVGNKLFQKIPCLFAQSSAKQPPPIFTDFGN
jgi:hypothetical protein